MNLVTNATDEKSVEFYKKHNNILYNIYTLPNLCTFQQIGITNKGL